ncbi:MAG: hypothetical protein HC819_10240 [Cyclobacteriaceae bacterium]|nr:hypothetical protein [Cyclobacteriaceae bacterium]
MIYDSTSHLPKPVPVGFDEENPVRLAPHLGNASGNLKFKNPNGGFHPSGTDASYITGWKAAGDMIRWSILPASSGYYSISVRYRGQISHCLLGTQVNGEHVQTALPDYDHLHDWTEFQTTKASLKAGQETELTLELIEIGKENELEIEGIFLKKE